MSLETKDLSVVSPCYNEADGVVELHRRVRSACQNVGLSYEVVLVDDGSRDQTWARILELAADDPNLVGVKLSRNHGHQLALTAGLTVCRGDRVLILDADLQDPPELLPAMLAKMNEGADVVYGKRLRRDGETFMKRATAAMFYRGIQKLTDTPIPEDTGDFRLMSRRALDVLLSMPERHRFVRGMVSWIGFRQEALLYDRDRRFAGETKYPLRKMIRFAVDAVTGFSTRPLTFAIQIGLATAVFSVGLVFYSFASWLNNKAVPGWSSIVAAMGLLGSAQLIMMGIIGEYLGRLYEQVKGRPLFIIETVARASLSGETGAVAPVEMGQ